MKNFLDIIYYEMYLNGKWDRKSDGERMLVESVKNNLNGFQPIANEISIAFVMMGQPTLYDVQNVLEQYLKSKHIKNANLRPQVDRYITDSFKRWTDDSVENEKYDSMDKAFLLTKTHGDKSKNPFHVPIHVTKAIKAVLDDGKTLDGFKNSYGIYPSKKTWQTDMSKHKWVALNEYLYRKCWNKTSGKGKAVLTDQQVKKIKQIWNIQIPNELEIYLEKGFARITKADAEVIKRKH